MTRAGPPASAYVSAPLLPRALYLRVASNNGGCNRDPLPGGITLPHGVSAAGPILNPSEGVSPLFVFGDNGVRIGSLSFVGHVDFEAPNGSLVVNSVVGPLDSRGSVTLAAQGSVTIG